MKSREEAKDFIDQQFNNPGKKGEIFGAYNYGRVELNDLLDFIYDQGKPFLVMVNEMSNRNQNMMNSIFSDEENVRKKRVKYDNRIRVIDSDEAINKVRKLLY